MGQAAGTGGVSVAWGPMATACLAALALALWAPLSAAQEIAPAHRAALLHLLDVLPAEPVPPADTPAALPGEALPADDERLARTASRFRELVNDVAARREALLPAYARHVDVPLATAWAAWWTSPVTRRYREVLPEVQAEWQFATVAWMHVELQGELGSGIATSSASVRAQQRQRNSPALRAASDFVRATGQAAAGLAGVQALLQDLPGSPLGRQLTPEMLAAATTLAKALAPGTPAEERLVALLAAPLAKRLGERELRRLGQFWQTPVGRQVAELQPALARDVTAASTAFGVAAAKRAAREVLGPLPQWRPPPPR